MSLNYLKIFGMLHTKYYSPFYIVHIKLHDDTINLTLIHISYAQPCIIYMCYLGAVSIRKTVLPGMAIPMLKIRRPNGRLIFNMEIAIRR